MALPVEKHAGTLPPEHAFLQTNADNVIVSSMKKSEDENALIVRFYEWAGKQGDVSLQIAAKPESASETNLMEKTEGSIAVSGDTVTINTKPYEIKTVELKFADKKQAAAAQP